MSTQAQIAANRRNAQSSTGPRTTHGKALASKNSLKHGLSANRDVITTESQEEFDRHRDALLAELDPQAPMESILADRIVSLSWRLKRADLIQNQTIDVLTKKDATNPLAKLAKSFGLKGLGLPQPDPSDSNPDLILGRIALKDFSNERVLDRLLMYERRIEHSLFKTMLELQRLRLIRNLNPSDQISKSNQLESPAPYLAPGPAPGGCTEQNNTPSGIPVPSDPIINNQSSIVNIESPPEPAYLAAGPVPAGCTEQNNTSEPGQNHIPHPTHDIRHPTSDIRDTTSDIRLPRGGNMQNEPNFQNHKTNTTLASAKNYNQKPPPPHTEKQTQTKPISPNAIRLPRGGNTRYAIREQTQLVAAKPRAKPDYPHRKNSRNRLKERLFECYNPNSNPCRSAWNPLTDEENDQKAVKKESR